MPGTTLTDRRDEYAVASIQGPNSRALLQRLTDADVSNEALPYYGALYEVDVAGAPASIFRVGFTAELGYEIMVPIAHTAQLWDAILAQKDLGVRLMGLRALMVARTEAGMLVNGVEYDRKTTPFECRLGWTIDFDKGNFQGRSALLAKKDSVDNRLVSIEIDASAENLDNAPLFVDGAQAGRVTVAVPSPVLNGKTLALARVNGEHASLGTELRIGEGTGAHAVVRQTPAYDPQRLKAKS